MNDADGFRLEAAEQFGFRDELNAFEQEGYFCTEAQLIAFAKACERKGLAEAHGLANRDAVHRRILDIDAELAPILVAEEERSMLAAGYVRGTDESGKRWIKPSDDTEICTLCTGDDSLESYKGPTDGHKPELYKGCMAKDGHVPEWSCDGKGNLTKLPENTLREVRRHNERAAWDIEIARRNALESVTADDTETINWDNLAEIRLGQIPKPSTKPAKNFWCIVALDYDKDEAWILDQSQDALDCDLLDGSSGDDNGLMGQEWVKSAASGLYKLYLSPWGHQSYEGEWDTGIDVSIVEMLVAFPPRLCEDEGCPQHGTEHVCVESVTFDRAHAATAAERIFDYADHNLTMFDACCDETPKAATDIYSAAKALHDLLPVKP